MDQTQTTSTGAVVREWIAQAQRSGVKDNYTAKRRSPRVGWGISLMVRFVDDPSREPLFVHARDISPEGVGFTNRQPVEEGTRLALSADDPEQIAYAKVTRCTRGVSGYLIGADFDE